MLVFCPPGKRVREVFPGESILMVSPLLVLTTTVAILPSLDQVVLHLLSMTPDAWLVSDQEKRIYSIPFLKIPIWLQSLCNLSSASDLDICC